jgi:hypothetical protein
VLNQLTAITRADAQVLNDFWKSLASEPQPTPAANDEPAALPEQFLILVECRDEAHQTELLRKFDAEGLSCKPLIS